MISITEILLIMVISAIMFILGLGVGESTAYKNIYEGKVIISTVTNIDYKIIH